jgi:hypothetical protein
VWWYSKRARKLADLLEEHRVVIAAAVANELESHDRNVDSKLETHRAIVNEKLGTLVSQTNGMSEKLQKMAEDKGIQEGRDQVTAELCAVILICAIGILGAFLQLLSGQTCRRIGGLWPRW